MHDRSRLVPWNKLVPSKRNVRKVKSDPAPLAANIEVDGLIHPLVVIERDNGRFEVAAGERRRRAIGFLIRAGKWERTALVAVEVRSEEEATALSLAENVQRVAMHPADAFRAFAALAAEGHDEAAIANRHGYDVAEVRRLLTLGQLSPRVLNALASDKIDVSTARAFTLTDDHARQEAILARCKTASEVRAMLTDTKVSTRSRQFLFVGDAYLARGGSVTRDLFAAEGDGYADDAALVGELVQDRLDELADAARAEGWGEVYAGERSPDNSYQWHRLHPGDRREPTDEEAAEIATLDAAITARREALGEKVYYDQQINELTTAIRKVQRRAELYTPGQKAKGILVITLASDGTADVTGYEKQAARSTGNRPKTASGDRPLYDAPMIEDLSRVRTAALQYEVAHNDALARDVLLDRLLAIVAAAGYFGSHAVQLRSGQPLRTERSFTVNASEIAPAAARVADELAAMPEDEAERFAWVRGLDDGSKTRLQSYCTAALLDATEGKIADRVKLASAARIATAADLDMTTHWEGTIEFWSRLRKRALLAALTEAVGEAAAENCAKMKKGELAMACAERIAGRGWLPPTLRAQPELAAVADQQAWQGDDDTGEDNATPAEIEELAEAA